MTEPPPSAVLHVTAAIGGGVDRYIRDTAAASDRAHFIWHAGDTLDVIEDLRARTFTPLRDVLRAPAAAAAIDAWRRDRRIGVVHLHGVDRAVRARLALTDRAFPAMATLHDVAFVAPRAFEAPAMPERDAAWIAEIAADLARVQAFVVPSAFIRREAEQAFPGAPIIDIAPGIAPRCDDASPYRAPPEFATHARRGVVAIVGAVGPHKGSDVIEPLARELSASGIALVVIGYTNEHLSRGWIGERGYFVHGPYVDDLAALLAAYGVDVVLFPNRLPESFSYTLSEVWAARVPVIVPDVGALGERVARHGGGWRLPARFDAADVAALIRLLFEPGGVDGRARVKSQIDPSDAARIPTLASMSRALDMLYERFAAPMAPTGEPRSVDALGPLLAANLDGFTFRAELLHFAEDMDNARTAIADSQRANAELRQAFESAQKRVREVEANGEAWAAKLERDIGELKREVALRDAQLDQLPAKLRAWLLRRALRDRA